MDKEYESLLDDFQSFMNNFENNMKAVEKTNESSNSPIKILIKYIINQKNHSINEIDQYIECIEKTNDLVSFFISMHLYYNITTKEELDNIINPIYSYLKYDIIKSPNRIFIACYLISCFDIDPNREKYDKSKMEYIYTFDGFAPAPPILKNSYSLSDEQYSVFLYRAGKIDGVYHSPTEASLLFKIPNKEICSLYGKAHSKLYHLNYPKTHLIDELLNNH